MVLRLGIEVQDLVDHAGLPLGLDVLEGHLVEHAAGELHALRLAQHTLAALDPREDAVAIEHLRRHGVVVHDLGLLALGKVDARQRTAHAAAEVLRGLHGEGQAQHVAGEDAGVVVGPDAIESGERQVDDAGGHHAGLARPRAGHEDVRLERHRDRCPLLVGGRRSPHRGDDLRGDGGRVRAHAGAPLRTCSTGNTGCPSGYNGHNVWKSQNRQFAYGFGR